jgi:hypothetical protein
MEAAYSFETMLPIYQSKWNHIPDESLTTLSREKKNMVMGPVRPKTKNDCAGEAHQQITIPYIPEGSNLHNNLSLNLKSHITSPTTLEFDT